MKIFDLLIIGAGPAGLGAGIQAGHMSLKHAVIEKPESSSRLLLARKVENFPLLKETDMPGQDLFINLLRQAKNKGVKVIMDACAGIDFKDGCFYINTNKNTYKTKAVIVAAGLSPKKLLAAVSSKQLENRHVFYRWTDIPQGLKNKRILVIGGGEVAFDQACSLADKGAKVTIAVRSNKARVYDSLLKETVKSGIGIEYGTKIEKIVGKKDNINVAFNALDKNNIWQFDHCLVAIGSKRSELKISPEARSRLNQGLFYAGDLADLHCRQAVVAFADGIKKTIKAYKYIQGEE